MQEIVLSKLRTVGVRSLVVFTIISVILITVVVIATITVKNSMSRNLTGFQNRRVIQTWKNRNVDPAIFPEHARFVKTLLLNDNVRYMFFDDINVDRFVKIHYPQCMHTFQNLRHRVQQIDMFRYLVIYHYGGLYYDMDMQIDRPFDQYESSCCIFPIEFVDATDKLLLSQAETRLLGNYAFYAPKGHPFLWKVIENIIKQRIPDDDIPNDPVKRVLYTTGPVMLTQTYLDYMNSTSQDTNAEILLIQTTPFRANRFGIYASHMCKGTWKDSVVVH